MRPRTLRRLRRRLSYANVMATLAFFFALTGASMAGVKYITASDVIPGTSDLAGSTYGNPLIAAGKVTSGKIADGAVTPSKLANPTAAFSTGESSNVTLVSGLDVTVQTLDLPPGKYMVTAKVVLANDETENPLTISCSLEGAGGLLSTGGASVPFVLSSVGYETMPLQATIASATADTIKVVCFAFYTQGQARASQASIDAVRVDSINGS
jgi:hypothetical protein